ncbi:MAG: hypothetical protein IJO06_02920 [Thermoguttaceae bacterium]|nr:hypothetical protein [Thermoguttaceae bacterium]
MNDAKNDGDFNEFDGSADWSGGDDRNDSADSANSLDSPASSGKRGSSDFGGADFAENRQGGGNGRSLSPRPPREPNAEEPRRVVVPPIIVGEDDFNDAELAKRGVSGDSFSPEARRRRRLGKINKTRKIFGLFPVPARWRELSTAQILWRWATTRRNLGAFVSVFLHLILVLILASIALQVRVGTIGWTESGFAPEPSELDFVDEAGDSATAETTFETIPDVNETLDDAVEEMEQTLAEETLRSLTDLTAQNDGATEAAPLSEVGDFAPSETGGGVPFYSATGTTKARTAAARRRGAPGREGDVTDESEDAVERGLDWLARHQLPDGGWSFDLTADDSNGRGGGCEGCSNSAATSASVGGHSYLQKLHPSRNAATAIALLPFLGAGYDHVKKNKYQTTVASGLRFLSYRAKRTENGIDFRDFAPGADLVAAGSSYVQALAVITICEAFEMTGDDALRPLAEGGLELIVAGQLNDGGWRYLYPGDVGFHPNVPGDASVLGWQLMALKSGVSAGFALKPSIAYRVGNFLDSIMEKNGRSYRYMKATNEDVSKRWGTTAVGVLAREYVGATPGTPVLDAGAEQIADWIDDANAIWKKAAKGSRGERGKTYFRDDRFIHNLYFSYYAALALHHYGGELWSERFAKLRDFLVATQVRGGGLSAAVGVDDCERGSWLFYDVYMNDGGRLLNTALAVLILETPYRYLPMYR